MKRILFLVFASCALLACISSCKKENKAEDNLVGSWNLVLITGTDKVNGEVEEEFRYVVSDEIWTFSEDGSFVWYAEGDSTRGRWTCAGGQLILDVVELDSFTITVLSITENDMKLRLYSSGDWIYDGEEVFGETDRVYTFLKVR